jgi:hypothetical protein
MTHRFTTVDPQKWLGILQRWHPRMPRDELVNFINEFIEALRAKRGKDRAVHRGNPLVHRKENYRGRQRWASAAGVARLSADATTARYGQQASARN